MNDLIADELDRRKKSWGDMAGGKPRKDTSS
jgi:hypothetical protein